MAKWPGCIGGARDEELRHGIGGLDDGAPDTPVAVARDDAAGNDHPAAALQAGRAPTARGPIESNVPSPVCSIAAQRLDRERRGHDRGDTGGHEAGAVVDPSRTVGAERVGEGVEGAEALGARDEARWRGREDVSEVVMVSSR